MDDAPYRENYQKGHNSVSHALVRELELEVEARLDAAKDDDDDDVAGTRFVVVIRGEDVVAGVDGDEGDEGDGGDVDEGGDAGGDDDEGGGEEEDEDEERPLTGRFSALGMNNVLDLHGQESEAGNNELTESGNYYWHWMMTTLVKLRGFDSVSVAKGERFQASQASKQWKMSKWSKELQEP